MYALNAKNTKLCNTKGEWIMQKEIPYKIYLEEEELPKAWMNLRAFMKNKPETRKQFHASGR